MKGSSNDNTNTGSRRTPQLKILDGLCASILVTRDTVSFRDRTRRGSIVFCRSPSYLSKIHHQRILSIKMTPPPPKKPRLSPGISNAASAFSSNDFPTDIPTTAAEIAVGITEYVNPNLPGWEGILKQRYSDFLVNEIEPSGTVVHLRTVHPARKATTVAVETVDSPKPDEVVNAAAKCKNPAKTPEKAVAPTRDGDSINATEKLSKLLSADIAAQVVALYKSEAERTTSVATLPIADKDARCDVHGMIRTLFSGQLLTETNMSSDPPFIEVKKAKGNSTTDRRRSKRGGKNHKSPPWDDLGGEYCHFTIYKENRDTMEMVNLLGRLLKVKGGGKCFSFAGTKDRRAVTAQRCAAHKVTAERLAGLNKAGDTGLRGARVGDFEYKSHGLTLGDLKGNEFVITLRQAQTQNADLEEAVRTSVEAVKRTGFANYFGLQRFGSFDVTTSDIGVYLLNMNWRGAVEKILTYDPTLCTVDAMAEGNSFSRDERERAEACDIFFTSYDFEKAAAKMPRKFLAENAILRYFQERGMRGDGKGKSLDYLGAIQAIPRGLRTMYAHAYQSLVWNNVLSARLRMSSAEVLPGDLVLVERTTKVVQNDEVDQDGEIVIAAAGTALPEDDNSFQRARALTSEEVKSGAWTIADVVLPTPGWDIEYPANEELMKVYKGVMAKDGLDPTDMRRSVREWSLPGSYRKMMSRFIDDECSYEIRLCKPGDQVVKTDLEIIEDNATNRDTSSGKKRKRQDGSSVEEGTAINNVDVVADESETVVVLRMRLGTSCYATMALRELMKGGCRPFKPEFGR
jgi:tRNA pseudouridine13 synthase